MKLLARLNRPWLHFIVLGGLLFYLHGILFPEPKPVIGPLSPARVEAICDYTLAQAYSGALRYLRVDKGYEVFEKDAEAAYLLFRYVPPGSPPRPTNGSIEIVRAHGKVKVLVRVPTVPEYQEQMLRDELIRKLRDEYGQPPPPKPKKAQPKTDPSSK